MVKDCQNRSDPGGERGRQPTGRPTGAGRPGAIDPTEDHPQGDYDRRIADWQADYDAQLQILVERQTCIVSDPRRPCRPAVGLPDPPDIAVAGDPADPTDPVPTISPEQIAYIAVARLTLSAPTPQVGPDPRANEWGMTAVGYPLWLWVDGDITPAPVNDGVLDAFVTLQPRLTQVRFDMGDGEQVTCSNVTTPWTSAVRPGAESPAWGYRYQRPSLPAGDYTVTATSTWAIGWQTSGGSGTIVLATRASVDVPVGELQVLVR